MDQITVSEKPLGVSPGTLLKLSAAQAHDRRGMIEDAGDGISRALVQLQFKVGEVVELAVDTAGPELALRIKADAADAPVVARKRGSSSRK